MPVPEAEVPIKFKHPYTVGAPVLLREAAGENRWYRGQVLSCSKRKVWVTYPNYPPEHNEHVECSTERLTLMPSTFKLKKDWVHVKGTDVMEQYWQLKCLGGLVADAEAAGATGGMMFDGGGGGGGSRGGEPRRLPSALLGAAAAGPPPDTSEVPSAAQQQQVTSAHSNPRVNDSMRKLLKPNNIKVQVSKKKLHGTLDHGLGQTPDALHAHAGAHDDDGASRLSSLLDAAELAEKEGGRGGELTPQSVFQPGMMFGEPFGFGGSASPLPSIPPGFEGLGQLFPANLPTPLPMPSLGLDTAMGMGGKNVTWSPSTTAVAAEVAKQANVQMQGGILHPHFKPPGSPVKTEIELKCEAQIANLEPVHPSVGKAWLALASSLQKRNDAQGAKRALDRAWGVFKSARCANAMGGKTSKGFKNTKKLFDRLYSEVAQMPPCRPVLIQPLPTVLVSSL